MTTPKRGSRRATKTRAAARPPADGRGVVLVERAIEDITRHGWRRQDAHGRFFASGGPGPVSEPTLSGLRLPGDRPLPASLRRWLQFDGYYIGVLSEFHGARVHAEPFAAYCAGWKPRRASAWRSPRRGSAT